MSDSLDAAIRSRAGDKCELCSSTDGLAAREVPPQADENSERHVLVCGTCSSHLQAGTGDDQHWFCLREAVWSDVPAVQVMSWRILSGMPAQEWAADLLSQDILDGYYDTLRPTTPVPGWSYDPSRVTEYDPATPPDWGRPTC